MKVAVTSRSFSRHPLLRARLAEKYPNAYFNDEGLNFSEPQLVEFLKDADAAIVGLEKINDGVLARLPNLKLISKYGVGMDNIQFEALRKHEVRWGYTAGTNRLGVAELALQMMLILIRKSYESNVALRAGTWSPLSGRNLTGKRIGILGLGNIGKELVRLLAPFQCEISCCDTNPDHSFIKAHGLRLVSKEELFSGNDVVTVHIPLNRKTRHLVNEELLDLMPKHGILINTARGGLVDEAALLQKLRNKDIAAAGFDVFEAEPCPANPLHSLENFFSTPHIGGSSQESIERMGLAAIEGLTLNRTIQVEDYDEL